MARRILAAAIASEHQRQLVEAELAVDELEDEARLHVRHHHLLRILGTDEAFVELVDGGSILPSLKASKT